MLLRRARSLAAAHLVLVRCRSRLSMEDAIAETEIQCVSLSGHSFTSILRVGRPRLHDRGMWSCSLSMDGLFHEDRPLFGDDSLQALCLAMDFARSQLQDCVSRGGQLVIPGTRDAFPLNAYFASPNI